MLVVRYKLLVGPQENEGPKSHREPENTNRRKQGREENQAENGEDVKSKLAVAEDKTGAGIKVKQLRGFKCMLRGG